MEGCGFKSYLELRLFSALMSFLHLKFLKIFISFKLLENAKRTVIYLKLLWYKVFVHYGFCLNICFDQSALLDLVSVFQTRLEFSAQI